MHAGLVYLPEDRKEHGLILTQDLRFNLTLLSLEKFSRLLIDRKAEDAALDRSIKEFDIRTPSRDVLVGNLSGGNQQKIVIGKWLSMHPNVLIVDEPTRGIDVGSKSEIHKLIRELARQGYAVIVISSEMPEVLRVSDRIVAMFQGRVMRTFDIEEVTEDSLVQAISGLTGDQAA